MEGKRYIISDASKTIDVESHVLRYWEEELEIKIPRNEMGHRYYTEFHIKLLKEIKKLKEQGFGLKAIKMLMPELMAGQDVSDKARKLVKEHNLHDDDTFKQTKDKPAEVATISNKVSNSGGSFSKMDQFQMILSDIVTNALHDNNLELSKDVSTRVSDSVIKEMDYLMRVKDEQEEQRYKRLDETIRNYQKGRAEAAASKIDKKKRLHIFKKKKK